MAQKNRIKTDEYDSLVIGAGLSGLLVANQLEGTGRRVALVESLDLVGGSCRPNPTKLGPLDHGLKFIPANEASTEALDWLESLLESPLEREICDAPPITFADGKLKPFIGFGDDSVASAEEISAYTLNPFLLLSKTPKDWIPKLSDSFTGTLFTRSVATKMIVEDPFVLEVIINGAKRLSGREVIFCGPPQNLNHLLPETQAPTRWRSKLTKNLPWTSVHLDLIHSREVTAERGLHLLKGTKEEPCVGLFHAPCENQEGLKLQVSQWLTLVPGNLATETEFMGSALKLIKKQIKRVYETCLDDLAYEKILVQPHSHGSMVSLLPEDGKWPHLDNLWVVSSLLDRERGVVGAIRQARRTLASLAGEPPEPLHHEFDSDPAPSPQPVS